MRAAFRRAVLGVVLGVVGGALALMIAIGRAGLVGSGSAGVGLTPPHQAALAPSFLVAFGLGGGLLGLLAPLRRTAVGALALGVIAASGFVTAVLAGVVGPPTEWSPSTWWTAAVAAALVGVAVAGQLQPERGQDSVIR